LRKLADFDFAVAEIDYALHELASFFGSGPHEYVMRKAL
jgi:hypothetical protein